jgi:hypothetical protein
VQKNCANCEIFNNLHQFWCIMLPLELALGSRNQNLTVSDSPNFEIADQES